MHFGPSEDQEIDTAWQPGIAPWQFQMVQPGYNAFALSNFSSGQIVKYVHPGSGESIAFQPQQLQYTNDINQIQAIANPQSVSAVVQDEDVLFWQGAFGAGMDIRWQAQTARLDKRLIVDQASRFPAPEQFILDGGNPVLRLQFIFAVSNGIDVFVNGVLWTRQPNSIRDTQTYVEFRLQGAGEVLWSFNLPRSSGAPVEDQDPDELLGTFRLRRTGPNLFVEHRIPIAWLQAADYPIEIDTTINAQVAASDEDAWEDVATGGMVLDDTAIFMGNIGGTKHAGFRFSGISGLGGATIDTVNSYLTFFAVATDNGDFIGDWFAHDAVSPGVFTTTTSNISDTAQRPRTTTTCEGDGTDFGNWTVNSSTNFVGDGTTTIGDIIQELADSYDPIAIALLWLYTSGTGERVADAYDNSTTNAAKLHIEYTAAAAGNPWYAYAQQ